MFTAAAVSPAVAQTAADDAVASRPRPDFAAQCIRVGAADPVVEAGGIIVCPTLDLQSQYEDNVFRDTEDERADVSARVRPGVALNTDWDLHALSVTGAIAATRYANERSNDSTDYNLAGNGRLDITDGLSASSSLAWGRFHRDRGDPDSSGAGEDVDKFTRTAQTVGVRYAPADLSIAVTVGAVQLDFTDTGTVSNDDEDRDEYSATVRAGLALGSGISFFVRPQLRVLRYDQAVGGVTRDSDGYDLQAGVSYDLSGVTFVEFGAGAFMRDFEDPSFADTSGVSVSARVVWNVTDLQTVTLVADRGLQETAQAGASSVVDTSLAATVDFDVAENVVVNTSLGYANQDFQSDPRDDDVWTAGIGAQYFINERLRANVSARHQRRRSNLANNDFDANTISLGVRLQF